MACPLGSGVIANLQRLTERSGSRVSILGGFRHTVSRATVCPLGQPKKAIGRESQIEPWLASANRLLAGAKEAAPRNAKAYDAKNLPKR
jgi:hypothetical protein